MTDQQESQEDTDTEKKDTVNMKCKKRGPNKQLQSCGNMTAVHEVIERENGADIDRYRCTECGSTWTITIGRQLDL